MTLDEIRSSIDSIDEKLIALFCLRMDEIDKISEFKKNNNKPVLDLSREKQKIDNLRHTCSPKYADYAEELLYKIMELSKSYQFSCYGKFGLLGQKLGHSYSPQIHRLLGNYTYNLYEKKSDELEDFLKKGNFDGLNVTIPYKKAVIPYLDKLSATAECIGSVNTIVKDENGCLCGYNTDYNGFEYLLKVTGINPKNKKCLVLGNGGVAPTIRAVLKNHGASEIVTVTRKGEINYSNYANHGDSEIIVNATPVGMYPDNGNVLVNLDVFQHLEGVLDVIYNPFRTKLILNAEKMGIPCSGGLPMLIEQAIRASEIFTKRKFKGNKVNELIRKIITERENIALIGMPGCGKTTTGKALSNKLGRKFIDLDEEIERRLGCSIESYFMRHSETEFREIETQVLRHFSAKNGIVIATGGGVVTREENYDLLRQNSCIVYLKRTELNELPIAGRPISQSIPIEELAKERIPNYVKWSDFIIEGSSPEDCADKIVAQLKFSN